MGVVTCADRRQVLLYGIHSLPHKTKVSGALQAWAEAVTGVRGGRLDWPVFLTALGASACPVQARAELASFIRLLASGVRLMPC